MVYNHSELRGDPLLLLVQQEPTEKKRELKQA
jgi:hypothetical protein